MSEDVEGTLYPKSKLTLLAVVQLSFKDFKNDWLIIVAGIKCTTKILNIFLNI